MTDAGRTGVRDERQMDPREMLEYSEQLLAHVDAAEGKDRHLYPQYITTLADFVRRLAAIDAAKDKRIDTYDDLVAALNEEKDEVLLDRLDEFIADAEHEKGKAQDDEHSADEIGWQGMANCFRKLKAIRAALKATEGR